jgi:branched-chain amino acid transport system substrate-binding protein
MKDKLFIYVSVAFLLLAVCAGPVQASATPSAGTTITIGGGFALTGEMSALDLSAAAGAKLAVKEINEAGGVNGRHIDLVIHDTQSRPDVTSRVCKQFVAHDHVVAVIGFTDTNSVMACGPTVQKAGLPFITAGATSPKIPQQIGDKAYLACFGDNVQAAVGAEFGFKNFGKNAYALWDKSADYTILLEKYFKDRYTQLGGSIVLEDSYDNKATDYSAQIAKINALPQQPDFYFIAAMPYNVGQVVKQFRAAGLEKPIIGGDGYDTPDIVTVAGKATDNVYFTTHALMDEQGGTAGIRKFIAAFRQEYGHAPANAFGALGYDTMYLLADAIRRAGSTEAAALLRAIQDTKDFPGITGKISYPNGSHVPQKGVTVIAIKDGKFTLGAEMVPEKIPAP